LASEYSVSAIPHIILFVDGKAAYEFKGADMNELKKMLEMIKPKAFCGKGYVVDEGIKVKEASGDLINELEKSLPAEPQEDGYNIVIRYGDNTFSRKFDGSNTIRVNFAI
jgi:thioredoxin-like negative regulator of GroEL